MNKSMKQVSLAVLTAATLALPVAADTHSNGNKCQAKTETTKCAAKDEAKCGAKCGAKCEAKCEAKCGAKDEAKCGAKCEAKDEAKCGAKCEAKDKAKCEAKCGAKSNEDLKAKTTRPEGYEPKEGDIAKGEVLFGDRNLSTTGVSCATCHTNNASYTETFALPYPHKVGMATQLGHDEVNLDEMIQACLVMPMAAEPLAWDSAELADLTAYVAEVQKSFKPKK